MSQSPAAGPTFYRSSDRVGARLWLVLPLVGGGVGAVLGGIYAFLAGLVTQVFESPAWFVVLTPLFGAALAMAGQWVCDLGQVRRRRLRLPLTLVVGGLGLYASWHFYLNILDLRGVFDPPPTWTMTPAHLARGLAQLAASQGWFSWLGWLAEAAVVFGMIAYLVRSVDVEVPFCERCGKWTSEAFHFELDASAAEAAAERLRRGDAAGLATLRARKTGDHFYALVRVFRCPCGASRFVSVDRAKFVPGKSAGLRSASFRPGHRELYLDPGSFDDTEFTPVLANEVIDEKVEQQLDAVRARLAGK